MATRIFVGDCRERLRELPDASVHCCVTSPPYFGLRDYGVSGQIGLEETPDAFVAEMVAVFREVRRVLRDDGVLFLNLGDSYFSSSASGPQGKSGQRADRRFTAVGAGARRAGAYGTSGTAPEGSPDRGCLCGSLCDACRRAYRLGKSHSDSRPVPTLEPSPSATSRGRRGSQLGRLPTLGSTPPAGHNADATPDLETSAGHEGAQLLVSPQTTTLESSRLLPEGFPLSDQPSECLSCGCSLQGSVPASAHTAGCTCGIEDGGSADRRTGMGASGSAYPDYTTASRLKPKDLIGIPWRVAFALQADGWWLRQDIIWSKPNPMPESVTDRCTKSHEYLFLLSKSATYHYDAGAIAEAGLGGGKFNGSPTYAAGDRNDAGRRDFAEAATRNKRSVWTVAAQPFSGSHFAVFPPALIEPCILAGCPVGGTVLDPFFGAGTTGLVADRLGRNCIGTELNPEYAAMAEKRIRGDAGLFAETEAA